MIWTMMMMMMKICLYYMNCEMPGAEPLFDDENTKTQWKKQPDEHLQNPDEPKRRHPTVKCRVFH